MKTLNIIGLSVLMCTAVSGFAQEENKLKVNPTGRILMDGGMFQSKSDNFVNGVAIPDVRVGVKASYGKYKAKVDVGYAYGKVSLKDIFVERQMTSHSLLRVGNFVHQFGLQSSTSSSMKITMEEPASNEAFFNSRLIGAMYIFDKDAFFGIASVHAENEALKKKASSMGGKMGYGAMSRLVYRPLRAEGLLFQAGISGAYESPRYNSDEKLNHSSFVLGANFPTRINEVRALNAVVSDANYILKFTPEILVGVGPIALESQYYYLYANRKKGFDNYNASGAYGLLRAMVIGGSYKHSHSDCGIETPGPGSLECVLGYNYTDMCDSKANILGGKLNDVSFTVNYYINKYMIWRFRYSYTKATNRYEQEDQKVNAFQTRLQIIF